MNDFKASIPTSVFLQNHVVIDRSIKFEKQKAQEINQKVIIFDIIVAIILLSVYYILCEKWIFGKGKESMTYTQVLLYLDPSLNIIIGTILAISAGYLSR